MDAVEFLKASECHYSDNCLHCRREYWLQEVEWA